MRPPDTTIVAFSIRGLRVDPWLRLPEVYAVGDVVRGCVCRINDTYVLVEVLPGAALIVLRGELDWTDRRDPADIFKLGERVNVKILTLDPPRKARLPPSLLRTRRMIKGSPGSTSMPCSWSNARAE